MTDSAVSVTMRAVEQFTEAYLTSIGAGIEKNGRRWSVTLPNDARSEIDLDGAVLEVVDEADAVSEGVFAIAPESPFVERLLDEAADRAPIGSFSLNGEDLDLRLPPWITASEVDVVDSQFNPYYDRKALCILFHVGIEAVSEYQRDELRTVALDLNGLDERPRLAETYLGLAGDYRLGLDPDGPFEREELTPALDTACDAVESRLSSLVSETQERATRAAEVELEEYEQFVRQRRDELTEDIDDLRARIEDATERIDSASEQETRVEALRERKELRSELEELRSERDELTDRIEDNFPEQRREIWERHSLTVRTRPVTMAVVSYERGDLRLSLQSAEDEVTDTYTYAVGMGVVDEPACEQCGEGLSGENPLTIDDDRVVGNACCDD